MFPREVGVVDEEAAVGGVVRMEGQAQETALAAAGDLGVDVEEGRGQERAPLHDPDGAGLLDDEDAAHVARPARSRATVS